ncbi:MULTISPECIES: cytochrome c oxidase subunit III [Bacillus]|uniref:Cytochrome B oxidoreductase n=2 Tax=Bacillus TaxID=1386 RepID=A0A0M3R974_9BACI|nr:MULTISPECIES: cytochrome c oxidase subunit III [Bacillus]ALC80942.1 cytochrome B oxidoreductase [Bacillus gobiensis]MBP1079890.1 cytochrome c oxidase subunit 3 [Bacillus capparidis]MED1095277.1 cytochrome c oxidase subunit III [Bacillus capparidis]
MNAEGKMTAETFPASPEKATLEGKNKFLGFWLFLGGETVLFASLFATFLALRGSNMGDKTMAEMFDLSLVFLATMLLLTSSLTSVYAMYHMKNFAFKKMQLWLFVTVLLGAGFLALEIYEFTHYTHEYHFTIKSSAMGSAFYVLVGTHGAHVTFGLAWIALLMARNWQRGLNLYNAPKFYVASLYWHFIDVVWVFIFTVVYLMGMVG